MSHVFKRSVTLPSHIVNILKVYHNDNMHHVIYSCFIYALFISGSPFFFSNVEAVIGEKVRTAEDDEFPFAVSIGGTNPEKNAQQNHFCTGILISRLNVLTAAHCLEDRRPRNVRVTFGTTDLLDERSHHANVSTWTTYNEWATRANKSLEFTLNDIAVLTLSNPISQEEIEPVRLSSLNNKQIERFQGIVAGFGELASGQSSRYLLTGNINILSKEACIEKIRTYTTLKVEIPEKQLCSNAEPYILTTCGDSGGPLVNMQNELVGMNLGTCPNRSWYRRCAGSKEFLRKYKFNAHASVDYYREFIQNFL